MALIKCPDCQKEISNKVSSCPHCGRPLKKYVGCFASLAILGLAFILIVILSVSYLSKSTSGPEVSPKTIDPKIENDVKYLVDNNVITNFNPDLNQADLNLAYWNNIKIGERMGIAMTLAKYCDMKNSSNRIELRHPYTGKILAKYGAFGYKSYE